MTALHFYVTVQRIFSHWPSAGTQALCRYFGKGPFPRCLPLVCRA